MERFPKKFFSIFMVCLFLFSGCGKENTNTQSQPVDYGRYVETEMTPPTSAEASPYCLGIFPHADGILDYLAVDMYQDKALYHYRSKDSGTSWEEMDTGWYQQMVSPYDGGDMSLQAAFVGEDGAVFGLLTEGEQIHLLKYSNGAPSEVLLEALPGDQNSGYILDCQFYAPDTIALLYEKGKRYINSYDCNSGSLKQQQEVNFELFRFLDDGYVNMQLSSDDRTYALIRYDQNGTETGKYPFDFNPEKEYSVCAGKDCFFLREPENGILELSGDGPAEKVLDESMYLLGSPSWETVRLQSYGDDSFYMVQKSKDDGSEKLYRYVYDANMPSTPSYELTVFSLYDHETLRQAVTVFCGQNPEWSVKTEIGVAEGSAATKDDVIRVMNTELLAKKGADVYILDGLSPETYIEKGVFADLSQIAESEGLFQNISRTYANEKGICAIPARFQFPVMFGEKTLVDSLTGLQKIAQQAEQAPKRPDRRFSRQDRLPAEERPLALVNLPWDPVKLFMGNYQPVFMNEEGALDETVLSELLSQTKIIYDRCWSVNAGYLEGDDAVGWDIVSFLPGDVYGERALLGIANLSDFRNFSNWALAKPMENGSRFVSPDFYFAPLCGPVENVYHPTIIMAVNENSEQKDTAMKFVQAALSKDVQQPAYAEGFPVQKEAFHAAYTDSVENGMIRYDVDWEGMVSSLSHPVIIDETVLGAILEEIKPYYNNEQPLEEIVSHIMGKLKTYIAEKS